MEDRLSEAVKYLASDELEGRGVETAGLEKAAQFLVTQFRGVSLKTDLFAGSPFQSFRVNTSAEVGPPAENRLVLLGPAQVGAARQRVELTLGKDFNPLAIGGSGSLEASLVFAGYGISAKDPAYDDYAGLDVKGKVVLMLRREPEQDNPKSGFSGKRPSQHAAFLTKVSNAAEHGAAAVIFVNDQFSLEQATQATARKWDASLDQLVQLRESRQQQKNASAEQFSQHRSEVVKITKELSSWDEQLRGDQEDVLPFDAAGTGRQAASFPVFFTRRTAVDPIVRSALNTDLETLERAIDKGPKPRSRELPGWSAECQAHIIRRQAEVKNVAAVLEGRGPLADETIVVGAHYDHIGRGRGSAKGSSAGEIHNGADDNASGTAALLEVARALARQEKCTARRRVLFLAFGAEERGLLGSHQYVQEPLFPLERTVAMVNLDMIGRLNNNKLSIHGTGTAKEFDPLLDELNKKYAFDVKKEPGGTGPSDHASFYAKQIPVLHFFTGTHPDYHRPSDDPDKINWEGMVRITDLVIDVVQTLATAENRPTFVAVPRPAAKGSG